MTLPSGLTPTRDPAAHQQAPKMQSKEEISKEDRHKLAIRRSPQFKNNTRKHKSAIKLAQEVLAKKWGIIESDKELEELTLQQYFDLYRKPLSQPAMMAIKKLTVVAQMKKKQKKKGMTARKKNMKIKTNTEKMVAAPLQPN
jgi:hypothetical protein